MITLREKFSKKGVEYTQLFKDNDLVIYRCSYLFDVYYEVFRYKVHKSDIYHDDEYEMYPCDEQFGLWAWCCSNIDIVRKVIRKHFNNRECPI